ncbi:MAG: polyprenyl synthetase family protein [Clostridia bacterium]|nr:polyprenyl synthetase family protein [Clostridia bacterium]
MKKDVSSIEAALRQYLPQRDDYIRTVVDSMEYSLMAGGKRIRPMLALAFSKLCGGSEEAVMPFACAVEMIHTYSLIHDDLPCMDNDDTRRGKPTNHKVFGEAVALLGGDGLLTLAFETLVCEQARRLNGAEKCAEAVSVLAKCAGAVGMIGGQIIDLESEGKQADHEILRIMDKKKTGALINAACQMGCISAGASEEQRKAAEQYAYHIGIAFQIVDDILDVTSDETTLGKPIGSDAENHKSTYVSLLGLDECRKISAELTEKAINALGTFEGDISELVNFAHYLLHRNQ